MSRFIAKRNCTKVNIFGRLFYVELARSDIRFASKKEVISVVKSPINIYFLIKNNKLFNVVIISDDKIGKYSEYIHRIFMYSLTIDTYLSISNV